MSRNFLVELQNIKKQTKGTIFKLVRLICHSVDKGRTIRIKADFLAKQKAEN